MALVPWRPLAEMSTLRHEMDRLFNRFFGEFPGWDVATEVKAPRLDMSETKENVIIKAELPGLEAKDLDVSISGDTLTIKGEKREEQEEKDEYRHVVERSYGAFSRMLHLPAPVAADKIDAKFRNGVLTITLPKTEQAKRKPIPVNVG